MIELLHEEQRLALFVPGPGFQLVFEWRSDRWVHYLGALIDVPQIRFSGDYARAVSSVEPEVHDHPPDTVVSPTFQEIHHEYRAGIHRVFLIGRSGPHHFSAVFELTGGDTHVEVHADITDRCREPLRHVASTYVVKNVAVPSSLVGDTFHWSLGSPETTLRLHAEPPAQLQHLHPDDPQPFATCLAIAAPTTPDTLTHRWRYRWTWTNSHPSDDDV